MGKHKKAHSTAQAAGSASHDVPASLRGRDQNSSLLQSAVKGDLPNSFPQGPDKGGEHCYAQLDGSSFQIRGPNYLEDKVKIDSCPSVFDLMHVDVFRSHEKIGNCAARHDSWLRAARRAGDTRYYFVVVYVTPADPFIHLVIYFAVQPDRARALPHFSKLWEQFTAHGPAADAFRDERWKVIPRVAEGSWIVSNAVGTKPALLAQKLTHTWIICDGSTSAGVSETPLTGAVATADAGCGATSPQARQRGGSFSTAVGPGPYLEADCDVASSSMAFVLVSLLQSYAKHIVIDLGFAIEACETDTLPECVLGSVRLSRIDVNKPPMVEALPNDWILGSHGDQHGGGSASAGGEDSTADSK